MDNKTLQTLSGPTFLADLCDHVTSGGALPDLCKQLEVKYSRVIEWIYLDADRAARYEASLKARGEWTIQSILNELKDIALADIRQAYNKETGELLAPDQWPDSLARVVQAVETEEIFEGRGQDRMRIGYAKRLKMWDKLRALELLGKNLKMFREQIDVTQSHTLEDLVLGSMKEVTDGTAQGQIEAPSS
jgi:hypothetical protein